MYIFIQRSRGLSELQRTDTSLELVHNSTLYQLNVVSMVAKLVRKQAIAPSLGFFSPHLKSGEVVEVPTKVPSIAHGIVNYTDSLPSSLIGTYCLMQGHGCQTTWQRKSSATPSLTPGGHAESSEALRFSYWP